MSHARPVISAAEGQAPFFAGVDLGDSLIHVGIVDDLGRLLCRQSIPTEAEKGPEDAARRIAAAVREVAAQAGLEAGAVAGLGLGLPGTLKAPDRRFMQGTGLTGWDAFPIGDRVGVHGQMLVTLANAVDAAACGEFWVGAGRGFHSLVYLALGANIGCGTVLADGAVSGAQGLGGDFGHSIIDCDPAARLCACGRRGHFDAYASATALVQRAQEALQAGRRSSLTQRIATGAPLTPQLLAREAEQGDELSLELVLQTAAYLGVGIVNLMHTVDPTGVLLGGELTFGGHESEIGRRLLARVKEEVGRRAFPLLVQRTVIDFASLGDDAGYLGAAGLARAAYKKGG